MRNENLYNEVSLKELKEILDQYDDDSTVQFFEIQIKRGYGVVSTTSRRIDE